jgi:hypothetical protein
VVAQLAQAGDEQDAGDHGGDHGGDDQQLLAQPPPRQVHRRRLGPDGLDGERHVGHVRR